MPKATADGDDYTMHSPAWLSSIRNHANRCKHAADNLAILARNKCDPSKKADLELKTGSCIKRIVSLHQWQLNSTDVFINPPRRLQEGNDHHEAKANAKLITFEPATQNPNKCTHYLRAISTKIEIISCHRMVHNKNSTDLSSGRRPLSKTDEFLL